MKYDKVKVLRSLRVCIFKGHFVDASEEFFFVETGTKQVFKRLTVLYRKQDSKLCNAIYITLIMKFPGMTSG